LPEPTSFLRPLEPKSLNHFNEPVMLNYENWKIIFIVTSVNLFNSKLTARNRIEKKVSF
jgi:hypothetical protein